VGVDGLHLLTWTRTNGRIEVQPFGRLPRSAVDAEIKRIRAFR
jgi:hypothetical protein